MKLTPHSARMYILLAAFFLALPTLNSFYKGQEGRFLIAASNERMGVFQETVIYITHHDLFSGARGFIVNRPLKGQKDVFYGGPVGYPGYVSNVTFQGRTRQYRGYTGWAPLQLEYEIIRGAWSIAPGDRATVFTDKPEALWGEFDSHVRKGETSEPQKIYQTMSVLCMFTCK